MATRHVPTRVTALLVAASGVALALLAAHTTPRGYRAGPRPIVSYHLGSAPPNPLPTVSRAGGVSREQSGTHAGASVLVLVGLVLLALAVVLARAAYRRRRTLRRPHRHDARLEAAGADEPGELTRRLDDAVAEGLADLERRPVREAIIACWVRMQASAERTGLPGRASDTPNDFVHRVLRASSVQPEPLATLARLYREARFSTHRMNDADRASARDALESIQSQLAVHSGA